jgi:hypothetical protein
VIWLFQFQSLILADNLSTYNGLRGKRSAAVYVSRYSMSVQEQAKISSNSATFPVDIYLVDDNNMPCAQALEASSYFYFLRRG